MVDEIDDDDDDAPLLFFKRYTLSSKTGRRRRRHHLSFDNNERTNGVVVVGRCLLGRKRSSRLLLRRRRLRKKFCGVERRHIGERERENTRHNNEEINALKKKKTSLGKTRPLASLAFSRETRGRGNVLFETVVFRVFGH